jgi:hypothetical protein
MDANAFVDNRLPGEQIGTGNNSKTPLPADIL